MMNVNEMTKRLTFTLIAGMQVMRRTGLMAPILAILSSSEVYASDITMDCAGTLYKYEDNFFQSDDVKVRRDGRWKNWCDGNIEVIDDSATCISKDTVSKKFKTSDQSLFELQPDFAIVQGYVAAYCKCGMIDSSNINDLALSTCLLENKFSKYGPWLDFVEIETNGLEINSLFLKNELCSKPAAAIPGEVAALMRQHPENFFNRNSFGLMHSIVREARGVSHIDFIGLTLDWVWLSITDPLEKTDYFKIKDCKLVEN